MTSIKQPKALVTGATGFIGGALAAALLDQGWQVNLVVRPQSRHKLSSAIQGHCASGQVQVFEADLADPWVLVTSHLRKAAASCEVVFHAAAIRDRWGSSLEDYRQTNIEGTRRLLQAALGGARRFIYVSSVGVFGQPGMLHIDETFPLLSCTTGTARSGQAAYHCTKAEAERLVHAARAEIEAVVVRPTITYGPGDQDGMLTRLIELLARGSLASRVRIGRGDNHLQLTYIDDLISGLLQAGTHADAPGQTFILAGPASIQAGQLINLIEKRLGCPAPVLCLPEGLVRPAAMGVELLYRAGEALRLPLPPAGPPLTRAKINTLCAQRSFSSGKAARLLGYRPQVDTPEGLERTLAWLVSSGRLATVRLASSVERI